MTETSDVYDMLLDYLGKSTLLYKQNETNISVEDHTWIPGSEANGTLRSGRAFYAYFTPVIMVIGFIGNSLSLNVFLSKNMRRLSASTYLAALSASDLITLFFYVTVEWFRRGYTYIFQGVRIEFLDSQGICQLQLYMSYASRCLSSWIVVAFTIERCIGVCYPLHRRNVCTRSGTRKFLISIFILSLTLSLYKPFLSGVYVHESGVSYCTTDPAFGFVSFILDNVFAILIAVVPFLIITVLNTKIIMSLILRNKRNIRRKYVFEKSAIKIEFTFTLFAISFCFVAFNVPFFAIWFRNFFHSKYISNYNDLGHDLDVDYWQGVLYITRSLFYINYCINFFLYSLTGTYFRREVKMLFTFFPKKHLHYCHSLKQTTNGMSQTWV